ncbi:MAG: response regulator [Thermodesulfovibrio sp.]|nr:response regulator [Thermodesulfovibrio sp.]
MSKGRILVIDDSPLVRKLAEVSLQEVGYEVFTADNGEDGLKIAENVNPDLILVDFIMPKMTGSQFCLLLKENERLKEIPILLITGKGEAVGQAFIEKYGVQDYFIKPFKSEDLIEKVDLMLKKVLPEEEKEEVKFPVTEEFILEKKVEEKMPETLEQELKLIPEEEEVIPEKPFKQIEFPASEEPIHEEIIEEKPVEIPSLEEIIMHQPEITEESLEREQEVEIKQEEIEPLVSEGLDLEEKTLIEGKIQETTYIPEEIVDIDEKIYEEIKISEEAIDTPISIEEPEIEEPPIVKEEISKFNLEEIDRLIENKLSDFCIKVTNLINYSIENTFKRLGIIKKDNLILSGKTFPFNSKELIQLFCKSKVTGFLTFFGDNIIFEFLLIEGKIVYGISSALKSNLGNKFLKDFTNEEIKRITIESIEILMKTETDNFILEEREKTDTYLDSLPRYDIEELI